MGDIAQLIRSEDIEFFNKNIKLDTKINDFGDYYEKLADHIAKQSKRYLTIKGRGLEEFLYKKNNLYELAGFLVFILDKSISKNIEDEIKVHVEADIEKINKNYEKEKRTDDGIADLSIDGNPKLITVINSVIDDTAKEIRKYFPKMPEFERQWNAALIYEFAGWVGSPGYEWPEDKKGYEHEIVNRAISTVIGTKDQLKRYKDYKGLNEEIMETLSGFE